MGFISAKWPAQTQLTVERWRFIVWPYCGLLCFQCFHQFSFSFSHSTTSTYPESLCFQVWTNQTDESCETQNKISVDLGQFILIEVFVWRVLRIGFGPLNPDSNWNKRLCEHAVPASLSSSLTRTDVDGCFQAGGQGQELISAQVMPQGRAPPPSLTASPAPPLLRTHQYRCCCHSSPEHPPSVLHRDWIMEAKHQQVCRERASRD